MTYATEEINCGAERCPRRWEVYEILPTGGVARVCVECVDDGNLRSRFPIILEYTLHD